jgi:hypothetical protein
MRNTIITFAATLSVALPAAWQPLGAGAPEDGAAVRPASKTLVTKQGVVEMTVDRSQIRPGDEVNVTLVATADQPRDIDVELWITERDVSFIERNDSEPTIADGGRFTVAAAPGGGEPKHLTFKLGEAIEDKNLVSQGGSLFRYEIAMFRARPKPLFYKGEITYDFASSASTEIAAVAPTPMDIEIEPLKRLRAGKEQIMKVHVRNTSTSTLREINLSLQGEFESIEPVAEDGQRIAKLGPGKERVIKLRVVPAESEEKTRTFTAYAYSEDGAVAAGQVSQKPSGEVVRATKDSSTFFVLLDRASGQEG